MVGNTIGGGDHGVLHGEKGQSNSRKKPSEKKLPQKRTVANFRKKKRTVDRGGLNRMSRLPITQEKTLKMVQEKGFLA